MARTTTSTWLGSSRPMVIEVVTWKGAVKSHVINQDFPQRTLCGKWIPERAVKYATIPGHADTGDEFPTCLDCGRSVMLS